ncbi:MAG: serine/threonine protein kinase [Oligoflexus sp.]
MDLEKKGYRVQDELHHSLYSTIYRALSLEDQSIVVVKQLNQDHLTRDLYDQFHREYLLQQKVFQTTNIVARPIEFIEEDHTIAIVMEHIKGQSLNQLLTCMPLDEKHSLLPLKILSALHQLHQSEVMHLNFHPANMILDEIRQCIRVLDFASASFSPVIFQGKRFSSCGHASLIYQSPEQTGWSMSPYVDYHSDFYSFGIVLYQILTGQVPNHADDWRQGILFKLDKLIHRPHLVDVIIPEAMWSIIHKLCEIHPENRYQSTAEIFDDLSKIYSTEVHKDEFLITNKNEYNTLPPSIEVRLRYEREEVELVGQILNTWKAFLNGEVSALNIISGSRDDEELFCRVLAKPILESEGVWFTLHPNMSRLHVPFQMMNELFSQVHFYLQNLAPSKQEKIHKEIGEVLGVNHIDLYEKFADIYSAFSFDQEKSVFHETTLAISNLFAKLGKILEFVASSEGPIVISCFDLHLCDGMSSKFFLQLVQNKYKNIFLSFSQKDLSQDIVDLQEIAGHLLSTSPNVITIGLPPKMEATSDCNLQLDELSNTILYFAANLGMIWSLSDLYLILDDVSPMLIKEKLRALIDKGLVCPLQNHHYQQTFSSNAKSLANVDLENLFIFSSRKICQSYLKSGRKKYHLKLARHLLRYLDGNEENFSQKKHEILFLLASIFSKCDSNDFEYVDVKSILRILRLAGEVSFQMACYEDSSRYLNLVWINRVKFQDQKINEDNIEFAEKLIQSLYYVQKEADAEKVLDWLVKTGVDDQALTRIHAVKMGLFEKMGDLSKALECGEQVFETLINQHRQNIFYSIRNVWYFNFVLLREYKAKKTNLKKNGTKNVSHSAQCLMTGFDQSMFLAKYFILCSLQSDRVGCQRILRIWAQYDSQNLRRSSKWKDLYIIQLISMKYFQGNMSVKYRGVEDVAFQKYLVDESLPLPGFALSLYAKHCMHWRANRRDVAKVCELAIKKSLELNDRVSLAESLHQRLVLSVHETCQEIIEKFQTYKYFFSDKFQSYLWPSLIVAQKNKAYSGMTHSLCSMSDDKFDENEVTLTIANQPSVQAIYLVHKLEMLYLAREFDEAYRVLKVADQVIHFLTGTVYEVNFRFLKAMIISELVILQIIDSGLGLNIIRSEIKKFRKWVNDNQYFHSYLSLLQAEKTALRRPARADVFYEAALLAAKECQSHLFRGLIYERYGFNSWNIGKKRLAKILLQDAVEQYELAGAYAKVQLLREDLILKGIVELPASTLDPKEPLENELKSPVAWSNVLRSEHAMLNIYALIEDMEILSYMERPDYLIRQLSEKCLLYTNSDKTLLFQKSHDSDDYWVHASILGRELIENSMGLISEYGDQFSRKVFDHAKQTGKLVEFTRENRNSIFSNDPYIMTFDIQVAICIPFSSRDGKWFALYMEKSLNAEAYELQLVESVKIALSLLSLLQHDLLKQKTSSSGSEEFLQDHDHLRRA